MKQKPQNSLVCSLKHYQVKKKIFLDAYDSNSHLQDEFNTSNSLKWKHKERLEALSLTHWVTLKLLD